MIRGGSPARRRLARFLCFLPLLSAALAGPVIDPTGFPFTNETLNYTGHWPSGVGLGEAHLSACLDSLLAQTCEQCGVTRMTDQIEVHHIRALKDLNRKGKGNPPEWARRMAARRRKTLVVCRACHEGIHSGSPPRQPR